MAACELFRRGCAVGLAKQQLAERFQVAPDTVDLSPLLRSLTNAGLIASVDGKRLLEVSKPSPASAWRYFVRFHLSPVLLRIAYKRLPLGLGRKLACWTWRLDAKATLWPQALRAAERFASCTGDGNPRWKSGKFARRYFRNLVRNFVDFESLAALTPAQVEAWFQKHVDYEGLEHLARLKQAGVPVIIAGFHFSNVKMMALLLTRHGYDANQVWLPDRSIEGETGKWLEQFRTQQAGFGRLGCIPGFGLEQYRRLIESVRQGELLVWFADMFSSRNGLDREKLAWRDEATRTFQISEFRTDLPQSKVEIELCGQRVHLSAWIGTFARLTGAAVVPATLIREGRRLKMILKPALRLPQPCGQAHVAELNRALFRELEALVRRYPDQWFGWPTLSLAD